MPACFLFAKLLWHWDAQSLKVVLITCLLSIFCSTSYIIFSTSFFQLFYWFFILYFCLQIHTHTYNWSCYLMNTLSSLILWIHLRGLDFSFPCTDHFFQVDSFLFWYPTFILEALFRWLEIHIWLVCGSYLRVEH